MKKYARIFSLISGHKKELAVYLVSIVLSTVFSIASIGMLMPFLQLIFTGQSASLDLLNSSEGSGLINWVNRTMASYAATHSKMQLLLLICGFMMLSIILKNAFLYLSQYILNPLKNRVVNDLRMQLFNKMLDLPIGYFNEKRKGDLISRITNDVNEVETSVVGTLEGWIRDPVQLLLNLTALLILSPQLTLFLLIVLPVMGFVIGRISRSLKKQSMAAAIKLGESVTILEETLGGLRVVKAFAAENLLRFRFGKTNDELLASKNKISYRRDLASPMSEVMGIFVFCCILLFGGYLVLSENRLLEGSVFITYLGLFYNIINPAKALSTSFYNMQKGSAAIGRIEDVLKADVVVVDSPQAKKLERFENEIEFRNVGFKYEEFEILKNINLRIRKGSTVALVGGSGAGKSTLADLVPRFHDVTSGELLIDGTNIKNYTLHSLRSLMGIVTQEAILFNDSIAGNIRLGKPEASETELQQAAAIANAANFIQTRQGGFDENIGDRGTKLSGGERQRLTIARAVLKNPPILILDEATSSLDTESEKLVQDAINRVMQDRTTLVIAHRLSTIRHADEIVVMKEGEIVERGTHDSLMDLGGYYHRLVEMQEFK